MKVITLDEPQREVLEGALYLEDDLCQWFLTDEAGTPTEDDAARARTCRELYEQVKNHGGGTLPMTEEEWDLSIHVASLALGIAQGMWIKEHDTSTDPERLKSITEGYIASMNLVISLLSVA